MMGSAETLIGGRINERVMTWLIVAVLIVTPVEAIGYDDPVVTWSMPLRLATLVGMLIAVRRGLMTPVATGRCFLAQATVTMLGASILIESTPGEIALESIAYGSILPIITLLIAPKDTRRYWSIAVTAVVIIATTVRLLPEAPTMYTQVLAVLAVHGAAVALLDVHTGNVEQANEMAGVDPLTGLLNRRETLRRLAPSIESAGLEVSSIVLLDLDHFKAVNDSLGHEAGDEALCQVTAVLTALLGPADTTCRWGGEEFLIHLPDTSESEASKLAEKLRAAVADTGITASFGVGEIQTGDSALTWVRRADAAMYAAKQTGRNRVVAYSEVDQLDPDTAQVLGHGGSAAVTRR